MVPSSEISNLFDGDTWLDVVLESDGGERVDGGGDGAERAGKDPGDEEAGQARVVAHGVGDEEGEQLRCRESVVCPIVSVR